MTALVFGEEKSAKFFEDSGIRLLRNQSFEIEKGLVIAGIDDLSSKSHLQIKGDFLAKAFENKPEGYIILMSHSPLDVEEASKLVANLMLSGHTHNGQIWPFNLVSKIFYPRNYGRFEVGQMTLFVTSGTGTWGPPMRLFHPNEIVELTLQNK